MTQSLNHVQLKPSDLREIYDERAAIAEYCGGLSRFQAESLARREIRKRFDGPLADEFLKMIADEKRSQVVQKQLELKA